MTRFLYAFTVFVMAASISACQTSKPSQQSLAAEKYLVWLEDRDGGVVLRDRSQQIKSMSFARTGEEGCKSMFHPTIERFAELAVFGAVSYEEMQEKGNYGEEVNPHLLASNLDAQSWDEHCQAMVEMREEFLGCKLSDKAKFPIGLYTYAHFDGPKSEANDRALEAFFFVHGGSMTHVVHEKGLSRMYCVNQ